MSGRRVAIALVAAVVAVGLIALRLMRPSGDEAASRAFLGALESHDFPAAVALLRNADGTELTTGERSELIADWTLAFGSAPGAFHVDSFSVRARTPVEPARRRAVAESATALTLVIEGTSKAPCLPLPQRQTVMVVIQKGGSWYVLRDDTFGYDFQCGRGQ